LDAVVRLRLDGTPIANDVNEEKRQVASLQNVRLSTKGTILDANAKEETGISLNINLLATIWSEED
jgi:hypothetical protein